MNKYFLGFVSIGVPWMLCYLYDMERYFAVLIFSIFYILTLSFYIIITEQLVANRRELCHVMFEHFKKQTKYIKLMEIEVLKKDGEKSECI